MNNRELKQDHLQQDAADYYESEKRRQELEERADEYGVDPDWLDSLEVLLPSNAVMLGIKLGNYVWLKIPVHSREILEGVDSEMANIMINTEKYEELDLIVSEIAVRANTIKELKMELEITFRFA